MGEFGQQFWSIVWLSVRVSSCAVVISAAIGIPLGVWLGLSRFRGKRFVAALLHTGMALPPVVVGLVLYMLLSRTGPFGFAEWLFTPQAMILAQTVLALPFVVGITSSAVSAVSGDLITQIRAMGASHWQTRWTVLLEARGGVLLAVAAAFGRSISEVGAVIIVGGNIEGHTRVLTTAIVFETSKGEFTVALALGAVLLALALLVNISILRLHGARISA